MNKMWGPYGPHSFFVLYACMNLLYRNISCIFRYRHLMKSSFIFILSTFLLIKSVCVYETNSSAGYQKERHLNKRMSIRIQSDTSLNWVVIGIMILMQVHSIGIVIILPRIRIRISAHTYVTHHAIF